MPNENEVSLQAGKPLRLRVMPMQNVGGVGGGTGSDAELADSEGHEEHNAAVVYRFPDLIGVGQDAYVALVFWTFGGSTRIEIAAAASLEDLQSQSGSGRQVSGKPVVIPETVPPEPVNSSSNAPLYNPMGREALNTAIERLLNA